MRGGRDMTRAGPREPRGGARKSGRPDTGHAASRQLKSKRAPSPEAASSPKRASHPASLPPAEIAASIDLLAAIESTGRPADAVVAAFLRSRPDLPAPLRGRMLARVDAVLRQRAALDWWIAASRLGLDPDARLRILAQLLLAERRAPETVAALFAGARGLLTPLGGREEALVAALAGKPLAPPEMPLFARAGFPAWVEPLLGAAFGERLEIEMVALAQAAPLDLRVNRLKASREEALAALTAEGLRAQPTPYSPLGLRLERRVDLGRCQALMTGLVEPQDEGSQIAALLVDAKPGQYVIDYCAGAGGKTLALAAAMANHGRLVAADVVFGRLQRARARLKRAGAFNVERRDATIRKWFKRQAGRVDRVLVDAPCTGIGSWRRVADARWRLRPEDLPELVARQRAILDEAAPLVALSGRLVYVTCSVLPAENEAQVEAFLARHPGFALLPVAEVWAETVGGACLASGPMLQLTPARHGTGGFFVAILERRRA